jgi:hypothetical protein
MSELAPDCSPATSLRTRKADRAPEGAIIYSADGVVLGKIVVA